MSNSLNVTKTLDKDNWEIVCELTTESSLPKEIFIYTNTGTDDLGEFFGTCSVEELGRLQIFSGVAIPKFGNKFVRYPQVKIQVKVGEDVNAVIDRIAINIRKLALEYASYQTVSYIVPIN
jgi:hypothetical protein